MKTSTTLRAAVALALGLAVNPSFAEDAALKAEIDALRAQMQEQARLLAEQQARLQELTKRLQASTEAPAPPAPAKIAAAPESPRLAFANGRPVITSADGKSSLAIRAIAQMDGAMYGESAEGPLASDFRRGSIGGGRENNAARDFSDGFSFRRARFAVDGVFSSN